MRASAAMSRQFQTNTASLWNIVNAISLMEEASQASFPVTYLLSNCLSSRRVRLVTTILLSGGGGKLRASANLRMRHGRTACGTLISFFKSMLPAEKALKLPIKSAYRLSGRVGCFRLKRRWAGLSALPARCAEYPESATSAGHSKGLRFVHGVSCGTFRCPFVYRAEPSSQLPIRSSCWPRSLMPSGF
jgi:hypothetical protein